MTTHFYRLMTFACGVILALFGFGCTPTHTGSNTPVDNDWDEGADEYACPYATFHIEGTVTDTNGKPIRGIQLTSFGTTTTAQNGSFLMERKFICQFNYNGDITIKFQDIDQELNGGLFQEKEIAVQLDHHDAPGTWNYGTYEKNNIYVTLERVGESDNDTLLEDEDGFTYPDDDAIYGTDDFIASDTFTQLDEDELLTDED